jgi:hypothetical protein
MKTEIFASYSAFSERTNKAVNGVTAEFADAHPSWAEDRGNQACWNCLSCSDCRSCTGCSDCSACWNCRSCTGCFGCGNCSDCLSCSDCTECTDCTECSGGYYCSGCSDCTGKTKSHDQLAIPTIPRIHAAVLAACSKPDALDMSNWHTCETTHCRAGWVVILAGEAGKALQSKTSTLFAAMQIYKASSPTIRVFPTRFFETNAVAMLDMKRCADKEAALNKIS